MRINEQKSYLPKMHMEEKLLDSLESDGRNGQAIALRLAAKYGLTLHQFMGKFFNCSFLLMAMVRIARDQEPKLKPTANALYTILNRNDELMDLNLTVMEILTNNKTLTVNLVGNIEFEENLLNDNINHYTQHLLDSIEQYKDSTVGNDAYDAVIEFTEMFKDNREMYLPLGT